ncbi:hypothetical protein BGW42_001341 [Actinomortierella wolfii]|nr:hypothetical protein BGW42_001341 [Actinomortierella wolfii]
MSATPLHVVFEKRLSKKKPVLPPVETAPRSILVNRASYSDLSSSTLSDSSLSDGSSEFSLPGALLRSPSSTSLSSTTSSTSPVKALRVRWVDQI